MAEKAKADIYLEYLDRILRGERDTGTVNEAEVAKLLSLAETMLDHDFSVDSKIREKLKEHILTQILRKDDELDEDALEHVAAGSKDLDEEQKDVLRRLRWP